MDGDGTLAHYPYEGGLMDQPAVHMDIYDVIRSKWCELKNQEMKEKRKRG